MGPAWNNYAPIAREGLKFVLIALICWGLAAFAFDHWSIHFLFAGLLVFLLVFFRNPARLIPVDSDAIVSPADGKVMIAQMIQTGSVLPKFKIAIFLSIFDVHINRAPIAGTVKKITYHPGQFAMAFRSKESQLNERNEMLIEDDNGRKVWLTQIAGWIARRIVCYPREFSFINAGDRVGLIQFGSRTDVIIEGNITPHVKVGDRVKGGSTILAHFVSPTPSSEMPAGKTQP